MNFFGHLSTISRHRWLVMKYCFRLGLYRQGLCHDLSKYSPSEFWAGVRYYQGNRSPNDAQRRAEGYSAAWLHHKGRNQHHLEYWIDYQPENGGRIGGIRMPARYLAEMFCDRVAASRIYLGPQYTDGAPLAYYKHSKDHYPLHPDTRAQLEKLLTLLRDEGEEAAFGFLRREILGKG